MGIAPVRIPGAPPIETELEPIAPRVDRPSQRAYTGQTYDFPAGWEERSRETPADIPTRDQLWMAAHDNAELNSAVNGGDQALWRVYDDIIRKGRAVGLQSPFNPMDRRDRRHDPDDLNIDRSDPFADWHANINEQIEKNPKLAEALGPITRQAMAGMADQLRRDAQDKYSAMREQRGEGFWSLDTLADLSAGMAASVRDPLQAATLPLGWGSKTVVGAIVKEAAVNAGVEAALQPLIIPDQVRIGNIATWEEGLQAAGANVATAAAFGAAFGGAGKTLEKGVPAAWNAIPGVRRRRLGREWVDELQGIQFNDSAVQSAVMGMVSDIVENGTLRTTRSTAEFLREAAGKAVDPAAAGRLAEMAQQIDDEVTADENRPLPESFEPAREAMTALARINEEIDPEAAAIIRKAMYDAERDFETARQAPEGIERDTFYDAVEQADARLRGLTEFMERPDPRRADPPADRLDIRDEAPAPKRGDVMMEDGKPITFTRFDPRKLGTAPDEFQYKRFSGEEGVNGAIADVETWHAPSSGKVVVFERANGEQIIADGHQRRAKAVGIMQAQGREDIALDGYLYREADGWTVSEVRLKAAQKNIREGRSDVLDTAQALRESPNAIDSSFPVSRSNIRQARQIARLSDDAWDLTRAGVLEPQYAALIGQVAPDRPEIHGPLARTLVEAAPDNARQAETILSEALLDYAERNADTQASLFGDDNLGRAVMYKERAQIMDAAYAWLRSERSVFKALVDKGDIARALGNQLVDAANLTAKDQVDLAIAAIMHSRKAGVRTAVSDMISRALDSVRREGVTPSRAGQQVARDIRALVEERGFRALLDAEGPRPPEFAEAGPLFDGPGSKAHAEHADLLEGDLRPEGREDPGVDLAKIVEAPDEMTSLVMELKNAEPGGARTPEQVLDDIRKLLEPQKEGVSKSADPVQSAKEEIGAEFRRLDQAEAQLRDALAPLTDPQKLALIRMQYPDAYAPLNRLAGGDLDDAIVGRVLLGDLRFARGRSDTPETFRAFSSDKLSPLENKIVEMAMNGISNTDIAVEMKILVSSVRSTLSRAKKKLADAGTPVKIEPGAMGRPSEGRVPGEMKLAAIELFEAGLEAQVVLERLQAQGFPTNIETVYVYHSNWRAAKRKGVKFAVGELILTDRIYGPGQPDALGFITSAERALANPPPRFRDAKALTAEQYRKMMREGGATKEAFTWQIEPALKSLADEGFAADIPRAKFEEALARNRTTMISSGVSGMRETYAQYVAPGPHERYRQEVLRLPQTLFAEPYRSHNWGEVPNPVGHIRTTERMASGQKVLHVEELQSDLHQEGAKYGYVGERAINEESATRAALVAENRYDEWRATQKSQTLPLLNDYGTSRALDDDVLAELTDATGRELWREAQRARASAFDAGSEARNLRFNQPPRAPMQDWEEPFVRHVLQTAARDGIDTVTFPTWSTLHSALRNEGTQKFYDQRLPNTLARVAKSLGLKVEMVRVPMRDAKPDATIAVLKTAIRDLESGARKQGFRSLAELKKELADLQSGGVEVPAIRLTPAANAKLAEGVAMYAQGRVDPRGATALDIIDRIRTEFGDGAMALMRVGELNVTDVPPKWVAPNTWGLTDARGRVTLFAANVSPDMVRGLMLHEVGVHAGLEGMLGLQGKANVLNQIWQRLQDGDQATKTALGRVPLDTDPAHVAEEVLAYLVQYAPKTNIVVQLLADIRAWLYKTFPKLQQWMTLTDADLHSLAMGGIRQRIREANWSTPVATTKSGAPFIEPIRLARRSDEFGLPVWSSGYEPRDLILMFNDGVDSSRMAVELALALGRPIEQGTLETRLTHTRTALRSLQPDPARYAAAANSMAVSTEELDAFIENIGQRRAPSLRAETKRLMQAGQTDRAALVRGLKTYADKHRLEFKESSLGQIIYQIKNEMGNSTSDANTLSTPQQRDEIIALRKSGAFPSEIAAKTGIALRTVRATIFNARQRQGVEFPPLLMGPRRPVSTGPVKYAKPPGDGPDSTTQSGGTQVSGGAGRPGQPDVRGGAAAGEAAAGGGNAQSGAGPARAVVGQQIPALPPSKSRRRWNEPLDLTPEQRAERKQQFREFVSGVEFDVEQSRGLGDFKFKNGKRTGDRGAYEELIYTLRQQADMHDSWAAAMDPEVSRLQVEIHGQEATVPYSRLADEFQSTGLGQKLYMRMIDDLLARGLTVNSDVSVSQGAIALWKSLRAKGYDVIQRVPDRLLERGPDHQFAASDDSTAIFFVARKKPPAPDLPISDRDLSNQIDEARALNEHIPSCIKGK